MEELAANTIPENIYSKVNEEGNQYLSLKEIIDHRKDGSAVAIDDKWIQDNVNRQLRCTTKGWKLNVVWKDSTTSWEHLQNLKKSIPIQVAEYAVVNKLVKEAAFAWWVSHVLSKESELLVPLIAGIINVHISLVLKH
jgi:hypothetical protein